MTDKVQNFAKQFIDAIPHAQALGLELRSIGDAKAVMALPYREELIGDPETGVIHGGAVFALVDTCGGASVMAHPDSGAATATLDLRIDYMRGANPGQTLIAEAECYHTSRSIAFCRVVAKDDDRDNPVATATGAFTLVRPKEEAK